MRYPTVSSADLFPLLHAGLRFRPACTCVPHRQVPRHLRDWLLDKGSLTQRLVGLSRGDFQVEVLRRGFRPALPLEQQALATGPRHWPFVREVNLHCFGQPWVYARTIIPTSSLQGRAQGLTRLGNKPLGAILFSDPRIERGPIRVIHLPAPLTPWQQDLWGRCSLFYLDRNPLLVSEYFLPPCPMYSRATHREPSWPH